jgi:hypothetical protein
MATAYVKYRSGGGYQQVADYDYVLDYRKLMEIGYYRDSGFTPILLPSESTALSLADDFGVAGVAIGPGGMGQYDVGAYGTLDGGLGATKSVTAQQPDEVSHTAPRQLSWFETTLTFLADSSQSEIIAAATNNSSRTEIEVANALLYSGKTVSFTGPDLPSALFQNQLYYATAISTTELLLQQLVGGAYVVWGDAGTAASTVITVVEKKAEFPWANIFGWSDTAPTR